MTDKLKVKRARDLAIKKMRKKGKTAEEIAQFFGMTRQRVYQILKEGEITNRI